MSLNEGNAATARAASCLQEFPVFVGEGLSDYRHITRFRLCVLSFSLRLRWQSAYLSWTTTKS